MSECNSYQVEYSSFSQIRINISKTKIIYSIPNDISIHVRILINNHRVHPA